MIVERFISTLTEAILDHYGEGLKGIVVSKFQDRYLLLIVLEGVDAISLLMRGEIFNYFYNKVKRSREGLELVEKLGRNPPVMGVVISPRELKHSYPLVIMSLTIGGIAYDPEGLLSSVKRDWKVKDFQGRKVIDLIKINKGEVVEL